VYAIVAFIKRMTCMSFQSLHHRFVDWTKPSTTSLLLGAVTDLSRRKSELVAENALLRKPLIILRRQVKRPVWTKTDRILLVLLVRMVRTWKQALVIVQPETNLAVASPGIQAVLEGQVQSGCSQAKVAEETVAFIKELARDNRLWGAERIRGELLKLGIRVCKRTIQKYMRDVRTTRPTRQSWWTFLRTHGGEIWACDFLQVTDLFFHPLFAFFIIELKTRKVIHVGVTRSPTDAWTARTAAGGNSLWADAKVSHP
jgi:putative transposase